MSSERLISALKQIELLVAECLKDAGSLPDKPASQRQARSVGKTKKTLSDHILELRDKAVFSEPQLTSGVHAKLQESYYCLLNRVQMALLRLQKKRELRRAVKRIGDHDEIAHVW